MSYCIAACADKEANSPCPIAVKFKTSCCRLVVNLTHSLPIMMLPTYLNLARITDAGTAAVFIASGPSGPQGNPRMYKYLWRVFSAQSPVEGSDFFMHAPILCTADYLNEVQRLISSNHSCMIYGFRRPRKDLANPWDLTNARWKGVQFASGWDDDTDPIVLGGHR